MSLQESKLLAARLELLAGDARAILIVSARSNVDTGGIAEELRHAMNVEPAAVPRYRIDAGRGLLDDPETVATVREFDGVVVAVQQGKTSRSDLEECRLLLESAGVRLITGVLLP